MGSEQTDTNGKRGTEEGVDLLTAPDIYDSDANPTLGGSDLPSQAHTRSSLTIGGLTKPRD